MADARASVSRQLADQMAAIRAEPPDGRPGEVIGMPVASITPAAADQRRARPNCTSRSSRCVATGPGTACRRHPDGTHLAPALGNKAKLYAHTHAPKAADAPPALGILRRRPARTAGHPQVWRPA